MSDSLLYQLSGGGRRSAIGSFVLPITPHPTPHFPTPYTLHPTPYTLRPTPYALHPTPHTPHPTLKKAAPAIIGLTFVYHLIVLNQES